MNEKINKIAKFLKQKLKYFFDKLIWTRNFLNAISSSRKINSIILSISVLLFFGIPFYELLINIINALTEHNETKDKVSIFSDILGLLGLLYGFASFLNNSIKYQYHSIKFKDALGFELQKIEPILESLHLNSDINNLSHYLIKKLNPIYLDLFIIHEDFYKFGLHFYQDLATYIAKYYKLNSEKRIFLEIKLL